MERVAGVKSIEGCKIYICTLDSKPIVAAGWISPFPSCCLHPFSRSAHWLLDEER